MTPHPPGQPPELRLLAWELTRCCNLNCLHCRAAAADQAFAGEFTTAEAKAFLTDLAAWARPIVILTGGEPLLRPDLFEIASHGSALGLKMVMAINGTLLDQSKAREVMAAGIKRVAISLDGASAASHDRFRGVAGAFESALSGIEAAKQAGLEFQINTTITPDNRDELEAIHQLAKDLAAAAHHIFLLVPTGRGRQLASLDAQAYEQTLNWFYAQRSSKMHLKATCAPHYYRILRQRAKAEGLLVNFQTHGLEAVTRGCLAGIGFAFVSHTGLVQPCGYLELAAGDVRERPLREIWESAELFKRLRDFKSYKGKCGRCEYVKYCGGCRARAYEATGDFLAEEPLCSYQPAKNER